MKLSGNTILITGGGSGIGQGLAEQFHKAGSKVIITGRRKAALDATIAANPGMAAYVLDVEDASAIRVFAKTIANEHPALNAVILNAGIMPSEDLLSDPFDLAPAEAVIATNLLGPIRMTAALLPQLRKQPEATIMTVSSGLAFIPLTANPTYCATKAAIHSWSQSLRHQLRHTGIRVVEIAPPWVQTDLMPGSRTAPQAMPLNEFIAETMMLLAATPTPDEILVERVKALRHAESTGTYAKVFGFLNAQAH